MSEEEKSELPVPERPVRPESKPEPPTKKDGDLNWDKDEDSNWNPEPADLGDEEPFGIEPPTGWDRE